MTIAQRTFAELEIRRARRRDPETSRQAAAAAHGLAAEHRLLILATLRGTDGDLNSTEIGERINLTSVQVCRRLHELEDEGLIQRTRNVRPTVSGRPSTCWEVVRG